jgi:hypothetical protein
MRLTSKRFEVENKKHFLSFLPHKNTFCALIAKANGLIFVEEIIEADPGSCTKAINTAYLEGGGGQRMQMRVIQGGSNMTGTNCDLCTRK